MGKQLKFLFLATLAALMVLAGSVLQVGEPLMAAPSMDAVMSTRSVAIANQLYTQYPDIPRIEQPHTTFLSRFIDYHLDAKARPGQYHFDWELSMAEYLDTATANNGHQPAAIVVMDRHAMQSLERQQRYQLVSSLEQAFTQ